MSEKKKDSPSTMMGPSLRCPGDNAAPSSGRTGEKRPSTSLGANEERRIAPNKHRKLQLTQSGRKL